MTAPLSLAFHPDAVDELDAAVEWYEGHTPGAGALLLDAVLEAIGVLREFPRSPANGRDQEAIAGVLHPREGAVFVLPDRDLILFYDDGGRLRQRKALGLAPLPVAALSPTGQRLAVASAGPSLAILPWESGHEEPPEIIDMPASLTGLTFAEEDQLLATTDDGALIGVDLRRREALVLRSSWLPSSGRAVSLVALPDGGLVGLCPRGLRRLSPAGVPAEPDAFRGWIASQRERGGGLHE